MNLPQPIILFFDGDCAFCQRSLLQILEKNSKKNIYFCSLQSPLGQQVCQHLQLPEKNFTTVIFYENGNFSTKSHALSRILTHLDNSTLSRAFLTILPRFLADFGYNIIARNRYKIIIKNNHCPISPAEWQARILS